MKKVIIIEGPDNLGKTSLAKYLQGEFVGTHDFAVTHSGPPPKGSGLEQLAWSLKYLKTIIQDFRVGTAYEIWDRSVVGECVYGPMYRKYDHEKYAQMLKQELLGINHRLFNIVLYTNGDIYKTMKVKSKSDEKEIYQTIGEAPRIATRFVDVFTELGMKHTLYINCENYATFDLRNRYIMKRVRAWLNLHPYEHLMTGDFTHTFFNNGQMLWKKGIGFMRWRYECDDYDDKECDIGCAHATISRFGKAVKRPTGACGASDTVRFIFVGEAPGQDGCGKLGIPFYDDRSGNLMQTTLDRLGIHPTHYYMTNVVKCCPADNKLEMYVNNQSRRKLECVNALKTELLRIIVKNPEAQIIALGKVAGYELSRIGLGLKHAVIYHPAYYLRMGMSDEFYREMKLVTEG